MARWPAIVCVCACTQLMSPRLRTRSQKADNKPGHLPHTTPATARSESSFLALECLAGRVRSVAQTLSFRVRQQVRRRRAGGCRTNIEPTLIIPISFWSNYLRINNRLYGKNSLEIIPILLTTPIRKIIKKKDSISILVTFKCGPVKWQFQNHERCRVVPARGACRGCKLCSKSIP